MSKVFALLAVLLIASGALVLAVPRDVHKAAMPDAVERPQSSRSLAPEGASPEAAAPEPARKLNMRSLPEVLARAREIAEQVNAPLSIIFGLVSLIYSRRTYLVNKERAERGSAA